MTGWHRGLMLAFDTETTGVNVETDRIVTACTALIDGSGRVAPKVTKWLANPGIDIPEAATAVHGITSEHARENGAEPALVLAEILAELHTAQEAGTPLVIVNAPFDLTLLDRECRRYDLPTLDRLLGRPIGPVVDPQVLDKHCDPYRKGKRTLTALCEHYQVRLDGAHDASFDAVAGARVTWRIAAKYQQYAQMNLQVLHGLQAQAKREQADSFREYLRARDKFYDDVRGEWPVIPFEGQAVIGR